MSSSGMWYVCRVPAAKYAPLQSEFGPAIQSGRALDQIDAATIDRIDAQDHDLDAIIELGQLLYHEPVARIVHGSRRPVSVFEKSDVVDGLHATNQLPTVLLAGALGLRAFARLPGRLGNMLVSPGDVEEALHIVRAVIPTDRGPLRERMDRFLLPYNEDLIDRVLDVLPAGLESAKGAGAGLLAVSFWNWPP